MLLVRNTQNPITRFGREREATSHAAVMVTSIAGHCSKSM
jgi:hypothetical protein